MHYQSNATKPVPVDSFGFDEYDDQLGDDQFWSLAEATVDLPANNSNPDNTNNNAFVIPTHILQNNQQLQQQTSMSNQMDIDEEEDGYLDNVTINNQLSTQMTLIEDIEKLKNEIDALSKEKFQHLGEITMLRSKVSNLEDQRIKLQSRINSNIQLQNKDQQSKVEKLLAEMESLKSQSAFRENHVKTLELQNKCYIVQLKKVTAALEEIKRQQNSVTPASLVNIDIENSQQISSQQPAVSQLIHGHNISQQPQPMASSRIITPNKKKRKFITKDTFGKAKIVKKDAPPPLDNSIDFDYHDNNEVMMHDGIMKDGVAEEMPETAILVDQYCQVDNGDLVMQNVAAVDRIDEDAEEIVRENFIIRSSICAIIMGETTDSYTTSLTMDDLPILNDFLKDTSFPANKLIPFIIDALTTICQELSNITQTTPATMLKISAYTQKLIILLQLLLLLVKNSTAAFNTSDFACERFYNIYKHVCRDIKNDVNTSKRIEKLKKRRGKVVDDNDDGRATVFAFFVKLRELHFRAYILIAGVLKGIIDEEEEDDESFGIYLSPNPMLWLLNTLFPFEIRKEEHHDALPIPDYWKAPLTNVLGSCTEWCISLLKNNDKQSFQKLFDTPAIIPTLLQVLVNTRDVNLYDGISRLLLILVCNNCGFVVERFNVDANVCVIPVIVFLHTITSDWENWEKQYQNREKRILKSTIRNILLFIKYTSDHDRRLFMIQPQINTNQQTILMLGGEGVKNLFISSIARIGKGDLGVDIQQIAKDILLQVVPEQHENYKLFLKSL